MRLLILTLQVAPYHNARYLEAVRQFGDVHVVSTLNTGDFQEFLAEGLGAYPVHRLYEGRNDYATAVASGKLICRVRETLSALRPEAIAVAGWAAPESFAALAYGREHGARTIVMSESQIDDATRSFVREAVKRRLVSQFDAALVGGPPHAEYAARLGIPRERIHFGYNAVDNVHFAEGAEAARADAAAVRARYGLPRRYVLASARFIAKKNLPSLVAAYGVARGRFADAPDLVVLGDGPERSAVEAAISTGQLGKNVHLPGFRSYDALPAFYGLSEGFVHVSAVEQWGLVINEAMAAGVPVVASRRCGAARTVLEDDVCGILTDTSVPAIADALASLFGMTPKRRAAMGSAAAAAIVGWGPQRFGAGMRSAVESALRAPRHGRLGLWDTAILKGLQSKVIDTVA